MSSGTSGTFIRPFADVQTAGHEHAGWLYLVYCDDQMAMLRLLITTWLDLAIVETLSLDEQSGRRLWFVVDEWDSLGKVDSLRGGLTKLRKYGGGVVAGFADHGAAVLQLRPR